MSNDGITYIWDQKPKPQHYTAIDAFYEKDEMDAWLDKLKLLYEALTATVLEQDKIISQFKENIKEDRTSGESPT